jgi:hypothetical protein
LPRATKIKTVSPKSNQHIAYRIKKKKNTCKFK